MLTTDNKYSSASKIKEDLKNIGIPLDKKCYILCGSAPLLVIGIRKEISDIDLLVTADIFETLSKKYKVDKNRFGDNRIIIPGKNIEVFDGWKNRGNTLDLLKDSEVIEGMIFLSLSTTLKWKRDARREKDINDIEMIEKYLETTL